MKSSVIVLCCLSVIPRFCSAQQPDNSGTYSTPANDGTGRSSRGITPFGSTGTGATRSNANFGGSFGTSSGTNLGTFSGTNLGQNLGVNGGTIIGRTNSNFAVQGTGVGVKGTGVGVRGTAVGVQGTGTALAPGNTAISPAGTANAVQPLTAGAAIPPMNATNTALRRGSIGIGQQGTVGIGQPAGGIGQQTPTALGQPGTGTALTPSQPNGFIINADGSVTPVPATAQGGTADTGLSGTNSGSAISTTNNATITNRFNSRP